MEQRVFMKFVDERPILRIPLLPGGERLPDDPYSPVGGGCGGKDLVPIS